MLKCEVIQDCSIVVKKGSVVLVDDRQFEVAKRVLKLIDESETPAKEKKAKKK